MRISCWHGLFLAIGSLTSSKAGAVTYACTIEKYFNAATPLPHQIQPFDAPWSELRTKTFKFDTTTGLMRHEIQRAKEGDADQWNVIQEGGRGNDIIAVCEVKRSLVSLRGAADQTTGKADKIHLERLSGARHGRRVQTMKVEAKLAHARAQGRPFPCALARRQSAPSDQNLMQLIVFGWLER